MASLKDLIPAEFFAAPPLAADRSHGTLSVVPAGRPNAGKILVAWERKSPCFSQNLAAARTVKDAGFGTYRPEAGGWVFNPNAAKIIDDRFPATLVRTAEFVALTNATPATNAANDAKPTTAARHGKIALHGNQYLVSWGGSVGTCPRDAFGQYLEAARSIKVNYAGSNGWSSQLTGWLLSRTAAAKIAEKFPAPAFDHCPELAADANRFPNAVTSTAAVQPATADQLAERLLAAAEQVLSQYA